MTNRVIWQNILVYIINVNMNETILGLDRIFEFTANNLRRWLQDFLRIKKETSERVIGVLCIGADLYQESIDVDIIYVLYLQWFLTLQIKNYFPRLAGAPDLLSSAFMPYIRLLVILGTSTQLGYWKIVLFPLFFYIVTSFYNDDDQWIKKWTKWKLDSLKRSIQPI